ncbi:hypothetical protein L218DRAFT_968090 [Marasmius fiardii PR-910]|nr:hypothetical protein L218DRAFT_968090 [Marasmius fiardii PR-910]
MFTDMDLAREMMADYHSKLRDDSPGQELFVMVLQTIILPPEVYRKYYQKRHPKRKLTWDHSLGTMDVRARFKAAPKELSVSMFQGLVLLLFNESTELGYAEIKEATGIFDDELRRTLQSLACGKKRVLKKVPMSAEVKDEDVFLFNNDFVDARSKIHVNSIQANVSVKESQQTQEAIEGDRKHVIDAAVKYFAPQVPMIKKRIDTLVEEEYLERSDTDRNVFRYLA